MTADLIALVGAYSELGLRIRTEVPHALSPATDQMWLASSRRA